MPNKLPLIGGHEGAGVVVKLGEGADQHVKIGDRVGIKWINSSCGDCVYCRKSHEPNCVKAECSGFSVDGSFQQYAVADAKSLTPIPAALSLETAAPLLCAGVTVYKACRQANFTPGDTVVIVGSGGGLGHLATQYASYMGARVIGIDTGADKKALSAKCGAEVFIDFNQSKDLIADIKAATPDGLGPQAAIVAASGAKAYEQALEYLRPRGTLVPVGLPPNATIKADVFWTVFKSLSIVASYVGNRQEAIEALDIAARGKINVVSRTLGLTDLPEVYKQMQGHASPYPTHSCRARRCRAPRWPPGGCRRSWRRCSGS